MSEVKQIPLSKLEVNNGQIAGLPKNPRFIKDYKFQKLKKSLEDSPEMLNIRELIVFPYGDKFVIIGGNMRYRAAKELKFKELPCKILSKNTSVEKLKEYTIKDNNAFGEYDWDDVANEWDAELLTDWGTDLPISADDVSGLEDTPEPEESEVKPFTKTFILVQCKMEDTTELLKKIHTATDGYEVEISNTSN